MIDGVITVDSVGTIETVFGPENLRLDKRGGWVGSFTIEMMDEEVVTLRATTIVRGPVGGFAASRGYFSLAKDDHITKEANGAALQGCDSEAKDRLHAWSIEEITPRGPSYGMRECKFWAYAAGIYTIFLHSQAVTNGGQAIGLRVDAIRTRHLPVVKG